MASYLRPPAASTQTTNANPFGAAPVLKAAPPGGAPLGGMSAGGLPPGVDPRAAAADPQGFAAWQQGRQAWLAAGGQDGAEINPNPMGSMVNSGARMNPNPMGSMVNSSVATPGAIQPASNGSAPNPFAAPGAGFQAFGPGNDLRGTSILPTTSASTTTMQGQRDAATGAYSGFQFSPFQGMQPLDFTSERGMLTGANQQMQGLGFDFGAANNAYGNAMGLQQAGAQQAGGMLTALAGAGGFGGGGASANTSRFNQELDTALQGLEGPDRAQLAADTMALLEERSQSGFDRAQRETGQRAAALGRLGSGMTTNDLTDIVSQRERLLDRSRRDLAIDAASQTLNDRLNVAGFQRGVATDRFGGEQFNAQLADAAAGRAQQGAMFGANLQRGIASDLYGMSRDGADLSMSVGDRFGDQTRDRVGLGERQAGFLADTGMGLADLTGRSYTAARDERDTARRDEFDRFDATGRRANDFQRFLAGERQNDFDNRQELRGERDFQTQQAEAARQAAIEQQIFNEWLRNSGWSRAQGAGQLGFGDSPINALVGAAGNARANAFG